MGMSGYILDLQEQFDTRVEEAVKQSEHVSEAVAEAMKHRDLVAHMTDAEVEETFTRAGTKFGVIICK